MADNKYSSSVESPYTLKQLIQTAYSTAQMMGGTYWAAWNDLISRGERHSFRLESVVKWKVKYARGVPEKEKVTTFRIRIFDVNMLRSYRSNYHTAIHLDKLSLDAPAKIRCGSYVKYSPKMDKEEMKRKGICGSFRFTFENANAEAKVLFGRDMALGIHAKQKNPAMLVGFCKHLVTAIRLLIMTDFFNQIDTNKEHNEMVKFVKSYTY